MPPRQALSRLGAALICAAVFAACADASFPPHAGFGGAVTSSTLDSLIETAQFSPFAETPPSSQGAREIIENPTLEDVMRAGPMPEMSWGRPDAPVTIVQYASLTCRFCRSFHEQTYPELKRAYIDTGHVRYILREFPIGKASGNATIALRCAPADKYLTLYGKFLEQQANWVSQEVRLDAIFAVASQVGITRAQFDACLANQSMIDALKQIKDRGRALGIIGTPNFFVAGKLVKKVIGIGDIRAMVEPILAAKP